MLFHIVQSQHTVVLVRDEFAEIIFCLQLSHLGGGCSECTLQSLMAQRHKETVEGLCLWHSCDDACRILLRFVGQATHHHGSLFHVVQFSSRTVNAVDEGIDTFSDAL